MAHSYMSANGMFQNVGRVYVDKPLPSMPYAQAGIRFETDGSVSLISYFTRVAYIAGDVLHVNGLYSMTTRKHISAFIRAYAPSICFADVRDAVRDNVAINIRTGERIPE